jgi:hypothetical protein
MPMRPSEKHETRNGTFAGWLCALGVLLAAVAPFVGSGIFGHTSPADEISGVLLMVALVVHSKN